MGSVIYDEEPDTKRIILGDMSDECEGIDVDIGDGIDIDAIQARREDERILHRAIRPALAQRLLERECQAFHRPERRG